MNEFESSTEETNIAEGMEQALLIGRGMTRPSALFPWIDPFPFVLREEEAIARPSYQLRREETYSRRIRSQSRVKKGPGKGRYRHLHRKYDRIYIAYYGIRN